MKTLIIALIAATSINSFAVPAESRLTLLDGDSLYCLNNYRAAPTLITSSMGDMITVSIGGTEVVLNQNTERNFLMFKPAVWVNHLTLAGDSLINPYSPICIGLIDDSQAPNAYAAGGMHILFGVRLLAETRINFPDDYSFATTFVMAHEFAHIIQQRMGLKFNYVLPMLSSKFAELNADCIAGYLLETYREIPFRRYDAVKTFVESLGASHIVTSHGMAEERAKALKLGMDMRVEDLIYEQVTLRKVTTQHVVNRCSTHYPPTK